MKTRLVTLIALCGLLLASPALALDLHEARSTGLVGEKMDGYIAAIKPSPDVNALVAEVNVKRRMEYVRISKQNGQPLSVVGNLAAQEIINNLAPGSAYQAPDGSWKTR